MADVPYVIGEKPVLRDTQGRVKLHGAHEGWFPRETVRGPAWYARELISLAVIAGLIWLASKAVW